MNKSLVIELANLPEEGKSFEGELDPALFDLPKGDAKPTTPLYYDLSVQRFEDELLVRGYISCTFLFTCARDNNEFLKTISLEEFGNSYEIESGNVDLTEALREEVLMKFPSYPHCDQGDDPKPCEINERYLAVDKSTETSVDEAPQSASDDRWDALDDFNQFKD